MAAKEVKVMCGVPGCGKSTWITQNSKGNVKVVSRDAVRFSFIKDDDDYFSHETEVFDEFIHQINDALHSDIDIVYVDATHISRASRAKLLGETAAGPWHDPYFRGYYVFVGHLSGAQCYEEWSR